jgi:hypothetical protein
MSIDELNKIDRLMTDKKNKTVILLLSDHLDWKQEGAHLKLLQDKLNVYLDFIEKGELVQLRPDLEGLPVIIRVGAKYPLSGQAEKFYRLTGPIAAEIGVSLELRIGSSEEITRF